MTTKSLIAVATVGIISWGVLSNASSFQTAIRSQVTSETSTAAPGLESFDAKQKRLASFSVEERDRLRRKKIEFDKLSVNEKQKLAKFHQQLMTHPDAERLLRVMKRYHKWLAALDGKKQGEFLDLSPDSRIQKIIEIKREQALEVFGRSGLTQLPADDAGNVFKWFDKISEKNKEQIRKRLRSPEIRKEFSIRTASDPDFQRRLPLIWQGGAAALLLEIDPDFIGDLFYEDIDELRTLISFDANQILDQRNVENQKRLIANWFADVLEAKIERPSDLELEKFASSLSQEQRDQLYEYSPQRYKTELMKLWESSNRRGAINR